MRDAVLVSAVRTPVGKAPRGTLRQMRPDDLGAIAVRGALERVPELASEEIEDVIFGCAMPEAEQGQNVARIIALRAQLPVSSSAMTINRYCSSGLQSIALAADRIRVGGADVILAGGVESMSAVPFGGYKMSVNPWLVKNHPGTYLSMGLTAEKVAAKYGVLREDADQFAYQSHRKALRALGEGKFQEELVPVPVVHSERGEDGCYEERRTIFAADEGPRADTSLDALSKLRPIFHAKGAVTAGNSSQTSDGAAAVILMSDEKARSFGIRPLGRFVSFAHAGCDPEIMGIGPVRAIPKALRMANLSLGDIGLIELNEAFAAQSLAVIRSLDLDPEKVNVNGGAIALGHPLGCTGSKLTASLLREMKRRKVRYGMVTMCVGGGMGAAGIFENLQN